MNALPFNLSLLSLLCASLSLAADTVSYKVDKTFGSDAIKCKPFDLETDSNNHLYLLDYDGTVTSFDANGSTLSSFKTQFSDSLSCLTVHQDKVFVFHVKRSEKIVEYQGRKVKRWIPDGAIATVFDPTGKQLDEFSLPDSLCATDAHFIGDELAVSDLEQDRIVFYSLKPHQATSTQKISNSFRLCCGIFNFCKGPTPNSITVANLGAFKVQTFTNGKFTSEFGQRGQNIEEFHSCCNPVNVAVLPSGQTITTEKGPTRVKIYDPAGKNPALVEGLDNLVEGCTNIPLAIDSHGAIYLASSTKKCIVKCIPTTPTATPPTTPTEAAEPKPSAGFLEIIEKCTPLMEAKDYANAEKQILSIFNQHPEMTADEKANALLGVKLTPLIEKKDSKAACSAIDEVCRQFPSSKITQEATALKQKVTEQIAMLINVEKEESSD